MNYLTSYWSRLTMTVALAGLLGWASALTPSAEAQIVSGTTYSGLATAIDITDISQGDVLICDTGSLPSTGGYLEANIMDTNFFNGALTLDLAHASTSGDGPETRSETALNNLYLEIMTGVGVSTLRVNYIASEAMASCRPTGKVDLSGKVRIDGLVLNGEAISVSRKVNQMVDFPGGRIIINEQTSTGNDISVIAIHILVEGCMNGIIGRSHAGITCGSAPPPPSDCGKLTGGGWIAGTPSGAKGNFGVSGGIRRGQYWGHLNYIDHGSGMHVQSTGVVGFTIVDATTRKIDYTVTIDGVSGTATVLASDKGEPGRDDVFDITLSNGYHAGGDLGGEEPGGGNIQLHKCPPGWQ